jgi:hypothetical protein
MGLTSVLTVVFVILKLAGVVDWSWGWVLSPTLIDFTLAMFISMLVSPKGVK